MKRAANHFPQKAEKSESVAGTGHDQAEQSCLRTPIKVPGRLAREFSSGTETFGGSEKEVA